MSLELQDLFGRLLFTETRCDVLALIRSNPENEFSVDQIATRIKHPREKIRCDMLDLIDMGLLRCRRVGGREYVSLDQEGDRVIQEAISQELLGRDHSR